MPFEGGLHAELLALPGEVGDLAGVQQGLGRDAAAVQAGPADLVLFDEDDRLVEFGCSQRGGITAASASENDDIGLVLGHEETPVRGR